MQTRSYMFSTAKKRSTLLENKGIEFPRDEKGSPRMLIMQKECPQQFQAFQDCLEKNPGKEENCRQLREQLFLCGKPGIRKANSDPNYVY